CCGSKFKRGDYHAMTIRNITVVGAGVMGRGIAYVSASAAKDIFPNMHIGRSVHSVEEATKKEREGAYYVMYGHIFETKSKPGLAPRGLNNLKQVARSVSIPTVAIGGIEPTDVESVFQAGASGIAVLSGILLAEDVKKAAEQYREKINQLVR